MTSGKQLYCVKKNNRGFSFDRKGAILEVSRDSNPRSDIIMAKPSPEDCSGSYKLTEEHKEKYWNYCRDEVYGPFSLEKAKRLSKQMRGVS